MVKIQKGVVLCKFEQFHYLRFLLMDEKKMPVSIWEGKKFYLLKHQLKRKFNEIDFVEGSNSKTNSNEYRVTYVMEAKDHPTVGGAKKYAMFIRWKREGKSLIVIGQNPSKAYNNSSLALDQTNQNLVAILKKAGYSGYVMINTFPDINPAGGKITSISKNTKNIKISKFLLRFFRTKILACSISNNVDLNYCNKILIKKQFKALEASQPITHFSSRALNSKGINPKTTNVNIVSITIKLGKRKTLNNVVRLSILKKKRRCILFRKFV